MALQDTFELAKEELVAQSIVQMDQHFAESRYTPRQKLALTCRILFDNGHDSGLAGQITARTGKPGEYLTQRLGLGFDEIAEDNLLTVDEDLNVLDGAGMPNPANRFHSWVYRARPDVNCIIHTHALHASALGMLEEPLKISHMDNCVLYDDVAFERAAKMHLLAAAAGTIRPIDHRLAKEAHDWIVRPRRNTVAFEYYARRSLKDPRNADCLRAA